MENIVGFKDVAPYLTQPLVLVGFVLLLVFGVHRALLKGGIIPPLTPHVGGKVVQSFLRYGFVIALVAMALGFLFAFYQTHLQHDPDVQKRQAETTRIEALAAIAKGAYCQRPEQIGLDEAALRGAIKACGEAVHALVQANVPELQKEDALARLQQGDAQGAKSIFEGILKRKTAEGKTANQEAAEAARHLGALAFYDNTKEALVAYQKAVELDPDNATGWNELGTLLLRIGKLKDAETAYGKVKSIAELRKDRELLAIAYGNLGPVYRIRGDLAQAESILKKGLEIDEAIGRKEGMAIAYNNLGIVYQIRGDLAQAETMLKKALEINETMGNKEGIANAYTNLGNVYRIRGDLAQAETMLKKALQIDEATGRKAGMATHYSNIGIVYAMRGDLAQAEAVLKKALEIHDAMGNKEGMATNYTGLANVYVIRGDLTQAEMMYKNALELDEAIGRKEGMATHYGNLGIVYAIRGDLAQAKAMLKKSIDLFKKIGGTAQAQQMQGMLDKLAEPSSPISNSNR